MPRELLISQCFPRASSRCLPAFPATSGVAGRQRELARGKHWEIKSSRGIRYSLPSSDFGSQVDRHADQWLRRFVAEAEIPDPGCDEAVDTSKRRVCGQTPKIRQVFRRIFHK